jgi:hypothetical protein
MTSTLILKRGKNYRITVYVPKETILKEMVAFLFWPRPGTFR